MLASHGHGDPAPYALDLLALDPDGVHRLFADLGFPHYRDQLQGPSPVCSPVPSQTHTADPPTRPRADHGISGDVLIHLDHAALKDVGVHSVGQRLAILKAVYDLKVAQDIPIEDGHYVPPCPSSPPRPPPAPVPADSPSLPRSQPKTSTAQARSQRTRSSASCRNEVRPPHCTAALARPRRR